MVVVRVLFLTFLITSIAYAGTDSAGTLSLGADQATDVYTHSGTVSTEGGDVVLDGGSITGVGTVTGDSGADITLEDNTVFDDDLEVTGTTTMNNGSTVLGALTVDGTLTTGSISSSGSALRISDNVDLSGGTIANVKRVELGTTTATEDDQGVAKDHVDAEYSDLLQWIQDNFNIK